MGVYIHVCVFYVHMVFDDMLLLMPATRKACLAHPKLCCQMCLKYSYTCKCILYYHL